MYYCRLPVIAFLIFSLLVGCGQRRNSLVDIGSKTAPDADNAIPVAVGGTFRFEQDKPYSDRVTASDADNDPLTYSVVVSPQHGTLSLSNSGAFTFTPAASYVGLDSFVFVASDGQDRSLPVLVSLEMTNRPVVNAPSGTFTVVPETGSNFLIGGKARITWSIVNAVTCQLNGTAVANSDTTLSAALSVPINFILECTGAGGVRSFAQAIAPVPADLQLSAPTNLVGNSNSATSVSLSWSHDGINALNYKIEQSKTTPASFVQVGSVSVTETTYTDTGLTPGTDYQYRVRAVSGSVNSSYSNPIVVRTQTSSTPTAPPDPTGFSQVASNPTSLNLSWTPPGGSTSGYMLRYAGSGMSAPADCSSGIYIPGASTSSYLLQDLTPNTTYSLRLCSVNSTSDRSMGVTTIATTSANTTTAQNPTTIQNPTGLSVIDRSASALTLAWTSVPNASYYVVRTAAGTSALPDCSGGTVTYASSITFSSLSSDTYYTFLVCAVDSASTRSSGSFIYDKTSAAALNPPPNILGFSQVVPSSNSISLSWMGAGGSTASYLVQYAYGGVAPADCTGGAIVSLNNPSYSITGLTPNATYSIRVCAVNSSGSRSSGIPTSASTLPASDTPSLPPEPVSLRIVERSTNLLSLVWSSGGGTTYRFAYRYAVGSSAPGTCDSGSTSVTTTSVNLTGLSAGTTYSIRVCSEKSDGTRSAGVVVSGATNAAPVAPANPTDPRLTQTTSSSIDYYWTAGDANASYYLVKLKEGFLAPDSCDGGVIVYATHYAFTGLPANTNHVARICAVSSAGVKSSGLVLTNSTKLAAVAPANPTNSGQTQKTANSIDFYWTAGDTTASYYLVRLAAGVSPPETCVSGGISGFSVYGATHVAFTGLTANTNYTARICAVNSAGVSSSGLVISASTAPAVVAPADPTISASPTITSSSIQLSWTAPTGSGNTYYLVNYYTGSNAPATCYGGTSVNGTTYTVSGLTANTNYGFRVCGVNSAGTNSPGAVKTLTTSMAAPTDAFSLQATALSDSMKLSWKSDGTVFGFVVSYAAGSVAPAVNCPGGVASNAGGYWHTLKGLSANTNYMIRVCGVNGQGVKSAGVVLSKATVTASNPTSLTAGTATSTSIPLSWGAGANATEYEIRYNKGTSIPSSGCTQGSGISNITGTSYTVSGLVANQTYSFLVCSLTSSAGVYSSGISGKFTTAK